MPGEFRAVTINGSVYPSRAFFEAWLRNEHPDGASHGDRPIVPVDELLEAIRAAERDSVRALLLTVDSLGGNNASCLQVHEALRAFPGRTVAYVRRAVSAMPVVVQAADVVMLDPAGELVFHGTIPSRSAPDTTEANAAWLRLLEERVGLDPRTWGFLFERWDAYGAFTPEQAVRYGLADRVGTLDDARRLAADLAAGGTLPVSERARRIARTRSHGATALPEVPATAASEGATTPQPPYDAELRIHELAAARWEKRTSLPASCSVVASNGSRLVAVGTNVVMYTDNHGESWSAGTMPAGTWFDVKWIPWLSLWVAVGASVAASSTDGATFTIRSIPAGTYKALADTGSAIAAVGASVAASSTTGTGWSSRSIPAGTYEAAVWSGTVVAAIGTSLVATAPADCVTWTARTAPSGAFVALDFQLGKFLAAGGSGVVATGTPDGQTWTLEAGVASSIAFNRAGLAWDGHMYAAATQHQPPSGPDGLILLTRDGKSWRSVQPTTSNDFGGMTWSGRRFVTPGAVTSAWLSMMVD